MKQMLHNLLFISSRKWGRQIHLQFIWLSPLVYSYVLRLVYSWSEGCIYVICLHFRRLTKFSKGSMRILVLHKNKEHIEECAAVLNEEWPRSKTARCSIYLKTENNYLFTCTPKTK